MALIIIRHRHRVIMKFVTCVLCFVSVSWFLAKEINNTAGGVKERKKDRERKGVRKRPRNKMRDKKLTCVCQRRPRH